MERVIVDTNFLIMPMRFNLDVLELIKDKLGQKTEFYVMKGTMRELDKLKKGPKAADRRAASFAIALLKAKGLKTLAHPLDKDVDSAIIGQSKSGFIVATQDMELRKKLKQEGVKVIYLRQKKYISID